MLDWVPAQSACCASRAQNTPVARATPCQAPAPERPIAGGLATPALLAQVLVSKYSRSHSALSAGANLRPPRRRTGTLDFRRLGRRRVLVARGAGRSPARRVRLRSSVRRRHASPGSSIRRGRTKTGRLWVYGRDQRPWGGPAPPAAVYISRRTGGRSDRWRIWNTRWRSSMAMLA